INTFGAALIKFKGSTGHSSYGTIKKANNFCKIHIFRLASERITPALSLFAAKNSSPFKIEQYGFQKFFGNKTRLRDFFDQKLILWSFGHMHQGMNRIFTFLRKHKLWRVSYSFVVRFQNP